MKMHTYIRYKMLMSAVLLLHSLNKMHAYETFTVASFRSLKTSLMLVSTVMALSQMLMQELASKHTRRSTTKKATDGGILLTHLLLQLCFTMISYRICKKLLTHADMQVSCLRV